MMALSPIDALNERFEFRVARFWFQLPLVRFMDQSLRPFATRHLTLATPHLPSLTTSPRPPYDSPATDSYSTAVGPSLLRGYSTRHYAPLLFLHRIGIQATDESAGLA